MDKYLSLTVIKIIFRITEIPTSNKKKLHMLFTFLCLSRFIRVSLRLDISSKPVWNVAKNKNWLNSYILKREKKCKSTIIFLFIIGEGPSLIVVFGMPSLNSVSRLY